MYEIMIGNWVWERDAVGYNGEAVTEVLEISAQRNQHSVTLSVKGELHARSISDHPGPLFERAWENLNMLFYGVHTRIRR